MRQGAVDTLRAGFAAGSSLANDAAAKHPVESMQLNVSAARSFSFLLPRLAARRRSHSLGEQALERALPPACRAQELLGHDFFFFR